MLPSVQDGSFSLLFGQEQTLVQYPHLAQLVRTDGYTILGEFDPHKAVYAHSLTQTVDFLTSHAKTKSHRNYAKRKTNFDLESVGYQTATQLREVLTEYYTTGNQRETEVVKIEGGSSATIGLQIPKYLSVDQLARVLFNTQRELNSRTRVSVDEIKSAL